VNVRLGITIVAPCDRQLPVNFRYAPLATEVVWRCNMSLRAIRRHQIKLDARGCWIAAAGKSPFSWPMNERSLRLDLTRF
jgi:hypothetical protein